MIKNLILFCISCLGSIGLKAQLKSIHSYSTPALLGGQINFAQYKGKKILIVNTASNCGFTSQYRDLQDLYEQYKDQLVIVGFPANDFGAQEPGSNGQIKEFCQVNYGVSFPMAAKSSVIGSAANPVFQFLTQKKINGQSNHLVAWNFTKFLLDEKGFLIDSFVSSTKPNSPKITAYLRKKS